MNYSLLIAAALLIVATAAVVFARADYLAGWIAGFRGELPQETGEYLRGYNRGVLIFHHMVEQEQAQFNQSPES